MFTYFYRNPRILVLTVFLLTAAGVVAIISVPRMEDPLLTPRAASITTILPGADAERVESLVTEKIEQKLKDVEEIKKVTSVSRRAVSFIAVELNDTITKEEAPIIWSRIRDRVDDARLQLPREALRPDFERIDLKAYALIAGVRWNMDGEPRYSMLRRLAKELKDRLDAIPGTEDSDIFGDPQEEIMVTIKPEVASSLSLTPDEISRAISASDSKESAGQLYGSSDDVLVQVSGEIDSLTQLGRIPIQLGQRGSAVALSDIATIERSFKRPLANKVVLNEQPAVTVGVFVQPSFRLDRWRAGAEVVMQEFASSLPEGIEFELVFDQEQFVDARMSSLLTNLTYGIIAVFAVNFLMLGWRSTWIVSLALPMCVMCVLFLMYVLEIPIHQMSITGLIIAMGLLVDNAIVIVDEVSGRLRKGLSAERAVGESVRYLSAPLLGATLTTMISFGPIALMPGPAGEFVGSIAVVAILAVGVSLVIALSVVATTAGLFLKVSPRKGNWLSSGIRVGRLTTLYENLLTQLFRFPIAGVLLGITLPILGFLTFPLLQEQFFPPADRSQFHVELELPGTGSIVETEAIARLVRQELLRDPDIERVSWFLGESAPIFYYNVIASRKNTPRFGQAIVDCRDQADVQAVIIRVQQKLEAAFPSVSCIARQLEQGPPFSAPVEVQIFGPDADRLRQLGEQVRLVLTNTPDVIQTRSDFTETLPQVSFAIDEQQARLAGLDHRRIASGLDAMLEGVVGGSILEGSEELPIRVRVSDAERGDLNAIASLNLTGAMPASQGSAAGEYYNGIPLSAISKMELTSETAAVTRLNGRRMNEIQAFITAGVLPLEVQQQFQQRLAASDFELPKGYSLQFGGAEAERNDALDNLALNVALLMILMIIVLVVALESFRLTVIMFSVAALAVGAGLGSLYLAGLNWGFMSVVGIMGMIGITVNDAIVVVAALKTLPTASLGDPRFVARCVAENTRHIVATSLTTLAGFTPLFLAGGDFWPPVAVAISGGVLVATLLALIYVPSTILILFRRKYLAARRNAAVAEEPWMHTDKQTAAELPANTAIAHLGSSSRT